jgi:hypothetical protein
MIERFIRRGKRMLTSLENHNTIPRFISSLPNSNHYPLDGDKGMQLISTNQVRDLLTCYNPINPSQDL